MPKRTLRVQKPKRRRKWDINPVTRVEESHKTYRRSAEKDHLRETMDEELTRQEQEIKGRILGLDYGERRVGLAVSDPLGVVAQGLETLHRTTDEQLLEQLDRLVEEYEVRKIVVGLPLSLKGSLGDKAVEVTQFIEKLKVRFQVPVVPWDERMTTTAAHRTMHELGQKAKGAKGNIDRIAAILILQSYLDSISKEN